MSPRHNPEFTRMEFYEAYSEYHKLMDFTEGLLRHAAREVELRHENIPNVQLVQQTQPADGRTQLVPPQRGIARVAK